MMPPEYRELLLQLSSKLGASELVPDENGAVSLGFDSVVSVVLQLTSDSQYVTLYSIVGVMEAFEIVELQDLLDANLFGQGTGGASFAMEAATGQIVLQQRERLHGLPFVHFQSVLSEFVNAAELWTRRLGDEPVARAVESSVREFA
jgi:hypothetical protein